MYYLDSNKYLYFYEPNKSMELYISDMLFSLPIEGQIFVGLSLSLTKLFLDLFHSYNLVHYQYQIITFSDIFTGYQGFNELLGVSFFSFPFESNFEENFFTEVKSVFPEKLYCSQMECLIISSIYSVSTLFTHVGSFDFEELLINLKTVMYKLPTGQATITNENIISYKLSLTSYKNNILEFIHYSRLWNVMERSNREYCITNSIHDGIIIAYYIGKSNNMDLTSIFLGISAAINSINDSELGKKILIRPIQSFSDANPFEELILALKDGIKIFFALHNFLDFNSDVYRKFVNSNAIIVQLYSNEYQECQKNFFYAAPSIPFLLSNLMVNIIPNHRDYYYTVLIPNYIKYENYIYIIEEIQSTFNVNARLFSIEDKTVEFAILDTTATLSLFTGHFVISLLPCYQFQSLIQKLSENGKDNSNLLFLTFCYYPINTSDHYDFKIMMLSTFDLIFKGPFFEDLNEIFPDVQTKLEDNLNYYYTYIMAKAIVDSIESVDLFKIENVVESLYTNQFHTPWGDQVILRENNHMKFVLYLYDRYPNFQLIHKTKNSYASYAFLKIGDLCKIDTTHRKNIEIVFLFSFTGKFKVIDEDLYISSLIGLNLIHNTNGYSVSFKTYDLKSDAHICRSLLPYLTAASFVIFGHSRSCIDEFSIATFLRPVLFFSPAYYGGNYCFNKLITTSPTPNQIVYDALYYLRLKKNSEYIYVLYDSEYSDTVYYMTLINGHGKEYYNNIINIDVKESIDDLILVMKHMGPIFYLGVDSFINKLIDRLDLENMDRDSWPILLLLLKDNYIKKQQLGHFEDVYMIGTYVFNKALNNETEYFLSLYEDKLGSNTLTEHNINAYLVFEIISKMQKMEHIVDFNLLYDSDIPSIYGSFRISVSNTISQKMGFRKVDKMNNIINLESIEMVRYPRLWNQYMYKDKICSLKPISYQKIKKKQIALLTDYYKTIIEFPYWLDFTRPIEEIMTKEKVNTYLQPNFKYLTQEECINLGELYELSDYDVVLLYASRDCIENSIERIGRTEKIIYVISNNIGSICVKNMIFGGRYFMSYLAGLISFITELFSDFNSLLIYTPQLEMEYQSLTAVYNRLALRNFIVKTDRITLENVESLFSIIPKTIKDVMITIDVDDESFYIFYNYFNKTFKNIDFLYFSVYGDYNTQYHKISISSSPNPDTYSEFSVTTKNLLQIWETYELENNFSNLYYTVFKGLDGEFILQPSNYLTKGITIRVKTSEKTSIFPFRSPTSCNSFIKYSSISKVCNWRDDKGIVITTNKIAPILFELTGKNSALERYLYSAISFYFSGYFNIYPIDSHNSHILPRFFNTEGDEQVIRKICKIIKDEKYTVVFGPFSYSDFIIVSEELKGLDIIIFYLGRIESLICERNVISTGISVQLLSEYYIRILKDYHKMIILLTDQTTSSINMLVSLEPLLKEYRFNYRTESIFSFEIKESDEYTIIDTLSKTNVYLINKFVPFPKSITFFTFNLDYYDIIHLDPPDYQGIYVINTIFGPSFTYQSKFDLTKSLQTESTLPYIYTPEFMAFYTSLNIWIDIILRAESISTQKILELIHSQFYESPSGFVYLYDSNTIDQGLGLGIVEENSFKMIKELIYYSSIRSVFFCENEVFNANMETANILLILPNYSPYRRLSLSLAAAASEIVNQMNYGGGLLERYVVLRLFLVEQENNVTELEQYISNNVIFSMGCTSYPCSERVGPIIESHNIPFISFTRYANYKPLRMIFSLAYQIENGLLFVSNYLQGNSVNHIIIIYESLYDGDKIDHYLQVLQDNTNFYSISILDASNTDKNEIIDELLIEIEGKNTTKVSILNIIPLGDSLVDFVYKLSSDVRYNPKQNMHIIFYYDSNVFEFFDNSIIQNHFVISSFIPDNSISLIKNFIDYLRNRLSDNELVSQNHFNIYTSLRILSTSMVAAQKYLATDNKMNEWPNNDYIRYSIHTTSVDSITGLFQPYASNQYSMPLYLGEIVNLKSIYQVSSEYNLIYSKVDEGFEFGYSEKEYTLHYVMIYFIYIVIPLIVVYQTALCGVLFYFRNKNFIKNSSPIFLIYINMSTCLLVLATYFYVNASNTIECTSSTILYFSAIDNLLLAILLKAYRIHALLYNESLTKLRLSDFVLFRNILIFLIAHCLISLLWNFFYPISKIGILEYREMSTTIEKFYFKQCDFSMLFLLVEVAISALQLSFCIYFNWTTRVAEREFNETKTLGLNIGILILHFIVTILVFISLRDLSIIFRTVLIIIVCLTTLLISSFSLLPKLYQIHKSFSSSYLSEMKSSSQSPTNHHKTIEKSKHFQTIKLPIESKRMANIRNMRRKPEELQIIRDIPIKRKSMKDSDSDSSDSAASNDTAKSLDGVKKKSEMRLFTETTTKKSETKKSKMSKLDRSDQSFGDASKRMKYEVKARFDNVQSMERLFRNKSVNANTNPKKELFFCRVDDWDETSSSDSETDKKIAIPVVDVKLSSTQKKSISTKDSKPSTSLDKDEAGKEKNEDSLSDELF